MKTKDYIAQSLEQGRHWLLALLKDIDSAATTFPTSKGGNHPLWVVGHVAYAEASMVSGFIEGKPSPLAKWEALFGMGSQPVADASKYPSLKELLAEYEKARAGTLKVLASLSEDDLDKPSKAPANMAPFFGTIAKCFAVVGMHQTFHAGQVADARRAAGMKPVLG